MMQDAMAAVIAMQKEDCLKKCTAWELAEELAKREEVLVARDYSCIDYSARLVLEINTK